MLDALYFDTRPGRQALFSPPANFGGDYASWIAAKHNAACYQEGEVTLCYGVAQQVAAAIFQARRGKQVIAFGPYAGALAVFIETVSGHRMEVQVLAGDHGA